MKKLVAVLVGLLILANLVLIVLYFATSQEHSTNSPSIMVVKGTPGPIGPMGLGGLQGETGQTGESIQGPPGPGVSNEQIAQAVSDYLVKNPPLAGANGADGQPGQDGMSGRQIELRTNPITLDLEWRYTGTDIWTILTTHCQLINTCQ